MIKYKRYFPLLILFIPTAGVLVLYGYLGSFTRLLADDFCSAYYAKKLGLLRSIWYWYLNWSGRYTAFATDWVMEKISAYTIHVVPPLLLLAWLVFTTIAIYLSLRHILPQAESMATALLLATLFLFVVFLLSPNIPQSLYWWNGMRSYSLPLILLTLYAILFQVGVERLKTKKELIAGGMISFLFMVANGGLGETYVAFQLILFTFLSALEWLVHRDRTAPRFIFLLAGLAGSIVSLILVVLAPGNAIRQASFPPHPGFVTLLQISIKGYLDFILEIVMTPEKIAGLLGALLASVWLGHRSDNKSTGNNWIAPAVFFGAFALSFACLVPGVYATSEPPPTRTFTIPVFILVACFLYTGFIIGQRIIDRGYFSNPVKSYLFIVTALLVVYSALMNAQHLYESRGIYIDFAQKWDETDALILGAKANNLESVQIPAMDNWAGLERPTDNERYWPNLCYSAYYDIQVFGPPLP